MYSEATIDDNKSLNIKLKAVRKKHQGKLKAATSASTSNQAVLIAEILDSIKSLLNKESSAIASSEDLDKFFLVDTLDTAPTQLPAGARGVP